MLSLPILHGEKCRFLSVFLEVSQSLLFCFYQNILFIFISDIHVLVLLFFSFARYVFYVCTIIGCFPSQHTVHDYLGYFSTDLTITSMVVQEEVYVELSYLLSCFSYALWDEKYNLVVMKRTV